MQSSERQKPRRQSPENDIQGAKAQGLEAPPPDFLMDPLAPIQADVGTVQGDVRRQAARGVQGGGGPLPHADEVQDSFGAHDVGDIVAHTDPFAEEANDAMGSNGYAVGKHVALDAKDLHTTAHEAAHVVQQGAGVSLAGGVGQSGDRYEKNADAVADDVVQGRSAEPRLDAMAAGSQASSPAVQLEEKKDYENKEGSGGSVYKEFKGLKSYKGEELRGLLKGLYASDSMVDEGSIHAGFGNQTDDGKNISPDIMAEQDDAALRSKLGGRSLPIGGWFAALKKSYDDPENLKGDDLVWVQTIREKAIVMAQNMLKDLPDGTSVQTTDGSRYTKADGGDIAKVEELALKLVRMGYDEAVKRIEIDESMQKRDNLWEVNLHWVRDGEIYKPVIDKDDPEDGNKGLDEKEKGGPRGPDWGVIAYDSPEITLRKPTDEGYVVLGSFWTVSEIEKIFPKLPPELLEDFKARMPDFKFGANNAIQSVQVGFGKAGPYIKLEVFTGNGSETQTVEFMSGADAQKYLQTVQIAKNPKKQRNNEAQDAYFEDLQEGSLTAAEQLLFDKLAHHLRQSKMICDKRTDDGRPQPDAILYHEHVVQTVGYIRSLKELGEPSLQKILSLLFKTWTLPDPNTLTYPDGRYKQYHESVGFLKDVMDV